MTEPSDICACSHGVYGHGFFEGDPRAGTEGFVNGCTEDDCGCRQFMASATTNR